jgi:very-short-patch-repair endonuclease
VVEFADGGAESPLESLARIVFRDGGLPPPELQVEIRDAEFIGRVDFLWRKFRTIAEVDGATKYDDRNLAMCQLRRDKRLREAGYEVVHFDWKEINGDPGYVVAAVRAAFEQGGPR